MSQPHALLRLLADGQFHSGEALGLSLGISRSAVWKQLQALDALGVCLHAVNGKGYRIPGGLDLLSREVVVQELGASASALEALHVLGAVDSTNRFLLERARLAPGAVEACLAEYQTAGRGRRGRAWVSPYAANLYLSLSWPFAEGAASLGGLSLGIALVVCEALNALGARELQVKWPNDVLFRGAKLCGILLEMVGEAGGPCQVVIGIGVNVRMPAAAAGGIEQAWTDLHGCLGHAPARNRLAGRLLQGLLDFLPQFERQGFAPFIPAWTAVDAFRGQGVCVHQVLGTVDGLWRGIAEDGSGLVETADGLKRIVAGEVSLRSRT